VVAYGKCGPCLDEGDVEQARFVSSLKSGPSNGEIVSWPSYVAADHGYQLCS
jgi:hypothetical protein